MPTASAALHDNILLELRRGALTLAVLAALKREQYGYALRQRLAEQGLNVEENTLYPLMRRLESQGLLVSQWRAEARRDKRFYHLSDAGVRLLAQLLNVWRGIDAALNRILTEYSSGPARAISSGR
jgi:PadR family transcriptional regulator PadR